MSWDAEVNESAVCVPVLIAKTARLHELASAPPGTRIITEETLVALKSHVVEFSKAVAADARWKRPDAVAEALRAHDLTADSVVRVHSLRPLAFDA